MHESVKPKMNSSSILATRLLGIGGNSVFGNQIQNDPDCDLLLEQGKVFSGYKAFIEMQPHQCHWNVAQLFEEKVIEHIAIGYALNYEGIWFQHTWGLKDSVIVETSEANFLYVKTYFGIVLEKPLEFVELCKNNLPGNGKVRRKEL